MKTTKKVNGQLAVTLISHQIVACFSQGPYQVWGFYTTYMYYNTVKTYITFRVKPISISDSMICSDIWHKYHE